MTSIHMMTRDVRFDDFLVVIESDYNKVTCQTSLRFPSNVIGCSLSIVNLDSLRRTPEFDRPDNPGKWSTFGAGIDDVFCNGNQVSFTAWMELVEFVDGELTGSSGILNSQMSYLTIQAIAECE